MNHYSNPTESAAIGAVDRELKAMQKRANQLKLRKEKGLLTPADLALAKKQFIGIYRRLLLEALKD